MPQELGMLQVFRVFLRWNNLATSGGWDCYRQFISTMQALNGEV